MHRDKKSNLRLFYALAAAFLLSISSAAPAFAFNIVGTNGGFVISDVISVTPPPGLSGETFRWNWKGAPGVVTIYYRIDPAFNAAEVAAIVSAFDTWNARVAVQPNILAVGAPGADLETVILHEIGHTIGLGHPDRGAAALPHQHWDTDAPPLTPVNPNPWNAHVAPNDITNLNLWLVRCAIRGFYVAAFGVPPGVSGAVMSYTANVGGGAGANEIQRDLEFDDVNGLQYTDKGANGLLGGGDDITYLFLPDPIYPRGPVVDLPGVDGLACTFDDWDAFIFGGNQRLGGDVDVFKGVPAHLNHGTL